MGRDWNNESKWGYVYFIINVNRMHCLFNYPSCLRLYSSKVALTKHCNLFQIDNENYNENWRPFNEL